MPAKQKKAVGVSIAVFSRENAQWVAAGLKAGGIPYKHAIDGSGLYTGYVNETALIFFIDLPAAVYDTVLDIYKRNVATELNKKLTVERDERSETWIIR